MKTYQLDTPLTDFDEFARLYDGRYNPLIDGSPSDYLLHSIQESVEQEVREVILPQFDPASIKGINVQFGFLYKDRPQAHVKTIGQTDCIGIELGFYSVMFDLMGRIFADSGCNIFPDGAVALASTIQNWSISNRPAVVDSHDSFVFSDSATQNHLEYLLLHSHRFLFHHEMAHVWNGHLALLESNQLEEVARKIENSTDLLRHCFELDADARAVHQTMNLITPCIYNDNRRFYASFGLDNSPIERSIYQGVFVIYLTMRLLAFLSKTKDPGQTHPSALHRLTWAVELLFTNLTHKSNQYPPKISQIIFSAVKICERGFCRITGELSIDIFQSDNLISSNEARDEILNSWEKLLPHLQDYKRGIVLPDVRRHGHDSNSVSQLYEFCQISARPASLRELFGLTVSSYSSRISYFWKCLEIENFCIRDEHLLAFEAELFKLAPLLESDS